jgi:hypothetical protein
MTEMVEHDLHGVEKGNTASYPTARDVLNAAFVGAARGILSVQRYRLASCLRLTRRGH